MFRFESLDAAVSRAQRGDLALLITGRVGNKDTAAQLLSSQPDRLCAAVFSLAGVAGLRPLEIAPSARVFAVPLCEYQIAAAKSRLHTRVVRKTTDC